MYLYLNRTILEFFPIVFPRNMFLPIASVNLCNINIIIMADSETSDPKKQPDFLQQPNYLLTSL